MRLTALVLTVVVFLAACGVQSPSASVEDVELGAQTSSTSPAWNERLEFSHEVIKVIATNSSGQVVYSQSYGSGVKVIDLPSAPERNFVPVPSTISSTAYSQAASASQQAAYTFRGAVKVITKVGSTILKPYGAVVSGELNVIAGIARHSSCGEFFAFLDGLSQFTFFNHSEEASHGGHWVCFATANIGAQDTS